MCNVFLMFCLGFLRKEIEKAGLRVNEPSEFPDAPHPQELIDLEVEYLHVYELQNYGINLPFEWAVVIVDKV